MIMKCHAYFSYGMTVRSGTLNGELIAGLKETAFCGEAQQVGESRSIDSPLQNIKTLYQELEHGLLAKFARGGLKAGSKLS